MMISFLDLSMMSVFTSVCEKYPKDTIYILLGMVQFTIKLIGGADQNSCFVSMIATPSTTLTQLDLPTYSQSRGRYSSRQIRSQNCWPSIHKWCVKKAPFIPISIGILLKLFSLYNLVAVNVNSLRHQQTYSDPG